VQNVWGIEEPRRSDRHTERPITRNVKCIVRVRVMYRRGRHTTEGIRHFHVITATTTFPENAGKTP
jgi:hypothetical protein